MYTSGYIMPLFSLATQKSASTNRTAAGGLLAIGGLPPVSLRPLFASSPFQLLSATIAPVPAAELQHAEPDLAYTLYTITINGLKYERSNEPKTSPLESRTQ